MSTDQMKLVLKRWDDGKRKPPRYTESGWFEMNGKTYCLAEPCSACPREVRCEKEPVVLNWNKSETVNIRSAIRARPGYLILSIDYKAIEVRIAANEAKERTWIDAIQNGRDLHTEMAALAFKKPRDKITKKERTIAKTLNFGNLYGGSHHTLARQAGIPLEEAKVIWDAWWAAMPSLKGWSLTMAEKAMRDGYIKTKFGRRRELQWLINRIVAEREKGDRSEEWSLKGFMDRTAANTPIQGGAADVMKIAMVRCHKGLKRDKLEDDLRMLLTVHDELVFEAKETKVKELATWAADRMKFEVPDWPVPMDVDIEVGPSWGELEHLEIDVPAMKRVEKKEGGVATVVEEHCVVKLNMELTVELAQLLENVIKECPGHEKLRIMHSGKIYDTKDGVLVSSMELERRLSDHRGIIVEHGKGGESPN